MGYTPTPLPLMPGGELTAIEITYGKEFTTVDDVWHDADHLHDFYEIYINLSGDVSFCVEDQVYPISRGAVILTTPNQSHRCIYHSDCVHEHFCIWIKDLPLLAKALAKRFAKQSLISFSAEDTEALIDHCFGLYDSHQRETDHRCRAAPHFFGMLDLICNGKQVATAAQSLPVRLTEILLYISRHFQEPTCNVSTLCEQFYVSKSALRRQFAAHFQTTPSAYIESRRFSEAKKLLLTGNSVQYACFHSGFSDCSYFVMRFRRKFGMTPGQYQKQGR